MFSFTITGNIAITALKFVNKVGTKMQRNLALEFKQIIQLIFRIKNNFYLAD